MASGFDRTNGKRLSGFPYTVQCLGAVARTRVGERVMREYVGSLNPGLLVKENLTEGALERWSYALILMWELWVPMFQVQEWSFFGVGAERDGQIGIKFDGEHFPNAHLGDYALEASRSVRALIAANAIRVTAG